MPSPPKNSPPKNTNDGWYKAGKKRKAASPLHNKGKNKGVHIDADIDQYAVHSEQSVSSILSATNEVLYGDPSVIDTSDNKTMADNTTDPGADTNRKLDFILEKLCKLDKIEEKLDRLDVSVNHLEQRMTGMERKTDDFEKSVNFMSGKIDEFQESCKKIKSISDDTAKHDRSIKMICNEIDEIRKVRDEIRETVVDLQCRSMKNNLVFSGLGGESFEEDTEGKIRDFLYYELGIEDRIEFGNVHRFGKYIQGRNRPIVARFLYFKDAQRVKDSAYRLKGKPYGINEQFPPVIENRRKQLYPVMRRLKQEGKKPKLVRDKIYVQGKRYDHMINTEVQPVQRNAPQNNRDVTHAKPTSEAAAKARTVPDAAPQTPTQSTGSSRK